MKKRIALCLGILMTISMVSCSNKNTESEISDSAIDIPEDFWVIDEDSEKYSEKETFPEIPIIREENGDVYVPISPEDASEALEAQAEKETNKIPANSEAYEMTGYWTDPQNQKLLFQDNNIYTVNESVNGLFFDDEGHYTELGKTMGYKCEGSSIIVYPLEFPDFPAYQLERVGDAVSDSIDGEYKLINHMDISKYPDFSFDIYYVIENGYVSIKNRVGKYALDEEKIKITMYSPEYNVVEGKYTVKGDMIVIIDDTNKDYIYKQVL